IREYFAYPKRKRAGQPPRCPARFLPVRGFTPPATALAEVLGNRSRHLEHRDLCSTGDLAELGVRIDHPPVSLILQAVRLDVVPHLAGDLRAGHRALADDRFEVARDV